jgi:hypothetical protein
MVPAGLRQLPRRSLPGRDADRELDSEQAGDLGKGFERRDVAGGLEAGDVGLAHPEVGGELPLAETVIGAIGDDTGRHRPGEGEALPLTAKALIEQLLGENVALGHGLGGPSARVAPHNVHVLGYITLDMTMGVGSAGDALK